MNFMQMASVMQYWYEEDDNVVIDDETNEEILYDPWSGEPLDDDDDWEDDYDE